MNAVSFLEKLLASTSLSTGVGVVGYHPRVIAGLTRNLSGAPT